LPFFLDVLGGVNVPKNVLGVKVEDVVAMTTYEEASTIVKGLYELGVGNIKMNYLGWFNDGYYHDVAEKVKNVAKLGSKDDFAELGKELAENGGALYGNVAFNEVSYASDDYILKVTTKD
jgi:hypothetical protein